MISEYKPRKDGWGVSSMPVDPTRCKAGVYSNDRACIYSQCSRKAKEDGWCKQHHPDAVAKREAASDAKWQARFRKEELRSRRPRVFLRELKKAVALLDQLGERDTAVGMRARMAAQEIREAVLKETEVEL